MLFNETFSRILWTVGKSKTNDFHFRQPQDEFYHQHSASIIGPDTFLIFDNGRTSNRIIEMKLDKKERTAYVSREYRPSSPLHVRTHGNTGLLLNGNVYGFFPSLDTQIAPSYIIEFDKRTKEEISRLELFYRIRNSSPRVYPMDTLGSETYLGFELPKEIS